MKAIHIFLASSINDLRTERLELGNFTRILNDRLILHDAYAYIHMCEDISDEVALTRKQDEYNRVIQSCDHFVLLFWRKIGGYTAEEYEIARKHQLEHGTPNLHIFFREPEGGRPKDVADFLVHLAQHQQPYRTFTSVHDLKEALLDIIRQADLSAEITTHDRQTFLNGHLLPGL
jgi:hypothetical protein